MEGAGGRRWEKGKRREGERRGGKMKEGKGTDLYKENDGKKDR